MRRSWRAFSGYIYPHGEHVCIFLRSRRGQWASSANSNPLRTSTPSVRRSGVCVRAAKSARIQTEQMEGHRGAPLDGGAARSIKF